MTMLWSARAANTGLVCLATADRIVGVQECMLARQLKQLEMAGATHEDLKILRMIFTFLRTKVLCN